MASLAPVMSLASRSWIETARERQSTLVAYGLILLAVTGLGLVAALLDQRTLDGSNVWLKPAKFGFSIAVFALTTAWLFGCVRPERRASRAMRTLVWTLIISGTLEIAYIALQAARGQQSHFNRSSALYEIAYGAMGVAAVLLVGTTLMLAWEIARRPAQGVAREYLAAVVIGLVLCFVLGGGLGMFMAQQAGHSVGTTGGRVPVFGWNRSGGDLRIAHFLGIHAQQAIPMLAVAMAPLRAPQRAAALMAGTIAYVGLTLATLLQALDGLALLPG